MDVGRTRGLARFDGRVRSCVIIVPPDMSRRVEAGAPMSGRRSPCPPESYHRAGFANRPAEPAGLMTLQELHSGDRVNKLPVEAFDDQSLVYSSAPKP